MGATKARRAVYIGMVVVFAALVVKYVFVCHSSGVQSSPPGVPAVESSGASESGDREPGAHNDQGNGSGEGEDAVEGGEAGRRPTQPASWSSPVPDYHEGPWEEFVLMRPSARIEPIAREDPVTLRLNPGEDEATVHYTLFTTADMARGTLGQFGRETITMTPYEADVGGPCYQRERHLHWFAASTGTSTDTEIWPDAHSQEVCDAFGRSVQVSVPPVSSQRSDDGGMADMDGVIIAQHDLPVLPKGQVRVGSTWKRSSSYGGEDVYTLTGFARVDGIETAVIERVGPKSPERSSSGMLRRQDVFYISVADGLIEYAEYSLACETGPGASAKATMIVKRDR